MLQQLRAKAVACFTEDTTKAGRSPVRAKPGPGPNSHRSLGSVLRHPAEAVSLNVLPCIPAMGQASRPGPRRPRTSGCFITAKCDIVL